MVDGTEDHDISLSAAAELTRRYRGQKSSGQINGGYFGKEALVALLGQTGCIGMRYYYGLTSLGEQVLVLVGVDANGDDMTTGDLAEASIPCPSFCGEDNDLNT